MTALFFWILAAGLVGSGLAVILNRNPVSAALSLAVTFLFLAALFVTLEAFFLAMVQIIVYAGAVMVLFLFIIMLLDIKAEAKRSIPWLRLGLVALLGVAGAGMFSQLLKHMPASIQIPALVWGDPARAESARDIGRLLFGEFVFPFEITAVLLLMATVGVVILSRREVEK
jgi:NADH-quinone oxidoreductase subunit J